MTDDEIREALRLDFEQTADWRRSKAAEYPEDSRNLEAAVKCSGRSVSTRGPKQPRTLLRRASPTGQWERKVREHRRRGRSPRPGVERPRVRPPQNVRL
jgi:hypothetical protein